MFGVAVSGRCPAKSCWSHDRWQARAQHLLHRRVPRTVFALRGEEGAHRRTVEVGTVVATDVVETKGTGSIVLKTRYDLPR